MFTIRCPGCQIRFQGPANLVGQTTRCPTCGLQLAISASQLPAPAVAPSTAIPVGTSISIAQQLPPTSQPANLRAPDWQIRGSRNRKPISSRLRRSPSPVIVGAAYVVGTVVLVVGAAGLLIWATSRHSPSVTAEVSSGHSQRVERTRNGIRRDRSNSRTPLSPTADDTVEQLPESAVVPNPAIAETKAASDVALAPAARWEPVAKPAEPVALTDEARLADEYRQWIHDLVECVGGDWADLLNDAKDVNQQFRDRLADYEKHVVALRRIPAAGVQRVKNRLLRDDDIVLLVVLLGNTSKQICDAQSWVKYAQKWERFNLTKGRREADRRNWEEACRVFNEIQMNVIARQTAIEDIWKLRSGRWQLFLPVGGTGGTYRPATPFEAMAHVFDKAQFAMSPIQVVPAHHTRKIDLWSPERLKELITKKIPLTKLQGLINMELAHLQQVHFEQVQRIMAKGPDEQRCLALASLGWWTQGDAMELIHRGLRSPADRLEHIAALTALSRLNLSTKKLIPFAANKQPTTVKVTVARLLQDRVGDAEQSMDTLQNLSADMDASVRQAAFAAVLNLFRLGYGTTDYQRNWAKQALRSSDPQTNRDAEEFLKRLDQQGLDG